MDDAENAIDDETEEEKDENIKSWCGYSSATITGWNPRNPSRPVISKPGKCNIAAAARPDLQLRHEVCKKTAYRGKFTQKGVGQEIYAGCDMYNWDNTSNGKVFPEYAHCIKPGGMQYTDCQIACYGYPDQEGCEAIKAMNLSEIQRQKVIRSLQLGKPITPPAPATKVNVEATLKSVTPGAIEISYTDPNTQKPMVVTKTLVDMYKPNDSVSIIIAKPAGTFLGFNKK
jgi:hypothetical protein